MHRDMVTYFEFKILKFFTTVNFGWFCLFWTWTLLGVAWVFATRVFVVFVLVGRTCKSHQNFGPQEERALFVLTGF